MQQLITVLKHGYSYTHTKEDGTSERVLVAPNRYMISAAKQLEHAHQVVVLLHKELDLECEINMHLTQEADKYRETIKNLENQIAQTKV